MLLRLCLFLAFLSCVRSRNDISRNEIDRHSVYRRFASWPSFHNGATMLRIRRENQGADVQGASEGTAGAKSQVPIEQIHNPAKSNVTDDKNDKLKTPLKIEVEPKNEGTGNNIEAMKNETLNSAVKPEDAKHEIPKAPISNETPKGKSSDTAPTVGPTPVIIRDNGTTSIKATKEWDLSNPEATKRGLIVFGGFALLALGYYLFFGTKKKYKDTNNTNSSDTNQFRYGVLQSEDRRDNLELSRVPLTMESDDEEDEDLEIFDLEQKKKSLSYVNLQTNDEDVVLSPRTRIDGDQLLLDIEDGNSDTLINWSNNGSKSIL